MKGVINETANPGPDAQVLECLLSCGYAMSAGSENVLKCQSNDNPSDFCLFCENLESRRLEIKANGLLNANLDGSLKLLPMAGSGYFNFMQDCQHDCMCISRERYDSDQLLIDTLDSRLSEKYPLCPRILLEVSKEWRKFLERDEFKAAKNGGKILTWQNLRPIASRWVDQFRLVCYKRHGSHMERTHAVVGGLIKLSHGNTVDGRSIADPRIRELRDLFLVIQSSNSVGVDDLTPLLKTYEFSEDLKTFMQCCQSGILKDGIFLNTDLVDRFLDFSNKSAEKAKLTLVAHGIGRVQLTRLIHIRMTAIFLLFCAREHSISLEESRAFKEESNIEFSEAFRRVKSQFKALNELTRWWVEKTDLLSKSNVLLKRTLREKLFRVCEKQEILDPSNEDLLVLYDLSKEFGDEFKSVIQAIIENIKKNLMARKSSVSKVIADPHIIEKE